MDFSRCRYGVLPVLFFLLGCATCHCVWAQNLVTNGGFEADLQGWQVVNEVGSAALARRVTDSRAAGEGALLVANTDPENLRPVGVTQTINVHSGKTYVLSIQCRNSALRSSGGVRMAVADSDGTRLSQRWVVQLHNWESNWRLVTRRIDVPKTGAQIELLLAISGQGTGWFDEVSLREEVARENPADRQVTQLSPGIAVTRIAVSAPIMKIGAGDLDGDGRDELVVGDVDNRVTLLDDGRPRWTFDAEGLICDIACGRPVRNGPGKIAVATMNSTGDVIVLLASGREAQRVSVDDDRCPRVAWADLDGDGADELVIGSGPSVRAFGPDFRARWELNVGGPRTTALTAGDLDGDGRDEVLIGYDAQTLRVICLGPGGTVRWRYQPSDWPGGCKVSSLFVADLDGDGSPQIGAAGSQSSCFVLEADGRLAWRHSPRWGRKEDYLAEPVSCAGDYPGVEMAVMGRHSLTLRAGSGPAVFTAPSGLTILDSCCSPTRADTLYIASSGLRDAACYRLRLSPSGNNQLALRKTPDPIGEQLDEIFKTVTEAAPASGPADGSGQRRFHVLLYRNSRDEVLHAWEALKQRGSGNVEYEILGYVKELPVELNRFPMTSKAEIIEYARFFEREGIPFYLFVDHGCRPWISVETAHEILQAAPASSRGFYVAEDNYSYPSELFDSWLEWAGEMLRLCHQHGKRMIFKQMHDCWSLLASDRRVYDVLFKYPQTIIPMFATNNPHAPEVQIGGLLGLWTSGKCRDWGMSSQHWNWNWGRSGQRIEYTDVCPADVILRMDLAAASLGCTYFHVEGGQEWLSRTGELRQPATRHRELLYRMMDRRVLTPVSAGQLECLSPVMIGRHTDPSLASGVQIGHPRNRKGTPFRDGLLGVKAPMQTVSADNMGALAYGLRRYFEGLFPATPYGYVRLLPWFIAPKQARVVRTNTADVTLGGATLTGRQGSRAFVSLLQAEADKLPFRTSNAFLSTQRHQSAYRLVLIDPGYLHPKGVTCTVTVASWVKIGTVSDALTRESVGVEDHRFTVTIPAGGFRVLWVEAP